MKSSTDKHKPKPESFEPLEFEKLPKADTQFSDSGFSNKRKPSAKGDKS
jgi:hypothetical protein